MDGVALRLGATPTGRWCSGPTLSAVDMCMAQRTPEVRAAADMILALLKKHADHCHLAVSVAVRTGFGIRRIRLAFITSMIGPIIR
jgi:hypothetical protein